MLKIQQHLLRKICLRVDEGPARSKYDTGISMKLEATGVDAMVRSLLRSALCMYRYTYAVSVPMLCFV
jgi:hypothetical protein